MPRPFDPPRPPRGERVTTGIPGLDEVLGGGLPRAHLYLIEGESGAG
jgi:circadian clock protein KaiC